jgi:hypothetical protein
MGTQQARNLNTMRRQNECEAIEKWLQSGRNANTMQIKYNRNANTTLRSQRGRNANEMQMHRDRKEIAKQGMQRNYNAIAMLSVSD